MKFKAGTRRKAIEYEKALVKHWKESKTFEKSVENRSKDNAYVFYDGPPFISGVPHHGTLLSSLVKDVVPRYQTMKGKRVERVWGWDCHGLPAERYTEKKLGIKSRQEVIEYGIEKYIVACRANMVQTSSEWEDVVDRLGRWVDFKGAYKTMDKEYMESVWWAFKTLYEKKKIYEGEKVLMYCTLDATPLSKAEVTMDAGAYQDVTDPSVYVKFKLKDYKTNEALSPRGDKPVYLLAWTTTPWTLPANTAVAVNQDLQYFEVEVGGEHLVMAEDLVGKVLTNEKHEPLDYQVIREFKGIELVGTHYEPLFADRNTENNEKAHMVWAADYVSAEDGTGIVHLAPTYGEEDFQLAQKEGFPAVHTIDENGYFTEGDWKGEYVWDINKTIAKDLHERGVVWKIDYIRHSYPHCHRCNTKLMYRAHPSWFMDIDGQRTQMLEKNQNITWFPDHVKNGRFAKNIEQAPDWNISRDRFWATAMPVWKGRDANGQEHVKVVGSYAELKELSGVELEDYHRPWVDDITFTIDGVQYKRIDKVMDSWFEAGSMPFAQFHYPFNNVEKFEANFPGDFIVEYIGQVRAWFYYMHAMSVALFGENSFKNVIVTGNVAGNDGRKMSKSYGNYTDPNEVMDTYSADALRFLLLQSPVLNGEDFALHDKDVADVNRKLSMIWNMYDFFTMYADVDGWEWDGELVDPMTGSSVLSETASRRASAGAPAPGEPRAADVSSSTAKPVTNPLDVWIISRVHQLTAHVDEHMQAYNLPLAVSEVLPFIEDASNWYVRRSRRRFWKSGDDADKKDAYRTLHYVLTRLSMVMAPFTPFLAEELYQKLTGGESVHLLDWPAAGTVDGKMLATMKQAREFINLGLSARAAAKLKVRQPLKGAKLYGASNLNDDLLEIVRDELNLKEKPDLGPDLTVEGMNAKFDELPDNLPLSDIHIELDTLITPELKREGLAREVVRFVQQARKQAGLNVDDRIKLSLQTESDELKQAVQEHAETIKNETLTTDLSSEAETGYEATAKLDGSELKIRVEKV